MAVKRLQSDKRGKHETTNAFPNLYGTTAPQTITPPQYDGLIYRTVVGNKYNYEDLRECAQHYVIKLGLDYLCGKLAAIPWRIVPTTKALLANEPAVYTNTIQFLQDILDDLRLTLLYRGLREMMIYGWAPFEVVWGIDKESGNYYPRELKPLLQQYTEIYIDQFGSFDGLRQIYPYVKSYVEISKDDSIVLSHDPIGQNWYGTSALVSVMPLYEQWKVLNNEVQKFFSKVVGSRHVLKFPVGQSRVGTDHNGEPVLKDNAIIAKEILQDAEQNASVAIPQTPQRFVDASAQPQNGWDFEVMADQPGNTPIFNERLKTIEAAMVNAIGFPSMVLLESLSMGGNRALIEGYTRVAQTIVESRNHYLAEVISKTLIDKIVVKNAGEDSSGFFKIEPGNISVEALTMESHPGKQQEQMLQMQQGGGLPQ